jgi:cholinesterase
METKRFFVVLLALFCLTTTAHATNYSSVVVYGDSLSDNGNLYAVTGQPGSPYYMGRRSDGPVAVEYLAESLGAPLVDFAWIGATTGVGNYADNGTVTSVGSFGLPGMTTVFTATSLSLTPYLPNGLFVVWGGPNDFLAPSPLDTLPQDIVVRAVSNELQIITALMGMGANTILAPGMPDLGLTPYFQSLPGGAALGTDLTNAFNTLLLANLPAGVLYYDTASLLRAVVANPGAYGFTNVTDPCFDGTTVCANPSGYLFFDSFHPTTATDAIVAQYFAATVVPEPITLVLLGFGFVGLAGVMRFK